MGFQGLGDRRSEDQEISIWGLRHWGIGIFGDSRCVGFEDWRLEDGLGDTNHGIRDWGIGDLKNLGIG